ncbi:hypothetical protein [Actinoplanes derwentensis]|uniref:Uncharacterized protein n=1 Tax=Actinoplanes derwentensis TaxID=113562 RepID=A0A1H2CV00_9ACTN|nr:hypothetical protein [Actinoplanes derwentensis]GID81959.1 hypothetical protein Ade03nite_08830 [Actinoplanes derwentensis]SDT74204.1 hypothetical protein SAMN04489716_6908 [Actinoplanes derwentensis]
MTKPAPLTWTDSHSDDLIEAVSKRPHDAPYTGAHYTIEHDSGFRPGRPNERAQWHLDYVHEDDEGDADSIPLGRYIDLDSAKAAAEEYEQTGQAPAGVRGRMARVRLTSSNGVYADFHLDEDAALTVEVDGREYVGVVMAYEDRPVQVVIWPDENGEDNETFTSPGVPVLVQELTWLDQDPLGADRITAQSSRHYAPFTSAFYAITHDSGSHLDEPNDEPEWALTFHLENEEGRAGKQRLGHYPDLAAAKSAAAWYERRDGRGTDRLRGVDHQPAGDRRAVTESSSEPQPTTPAGAIPEASCRRCHETFVPADDEHLAREDGQPCGGTSDLRGSWHTPQAATEFVPVDRFGQLTVEITREQLQEWAGRSLTDDDVYSLDDAIPNSSIPEAIAVIVDGLGSDE